MLSFVLTVSLYAFLFQGSSSSEDQNIIDLSIIDYSYKQEHNYETVEFSKYSEITNITTKNCKICSFLNKFKMKCRKNDFIRMEFEFRKNISIPYNISCDGQYSKKYYKIKMDTETGPNEISLSWTTTPFYEKIRHFVVLCINNSANYTSYIVNLNLEKQIFSYVLTKLKERSWYQICIAAVDNEWLTGRFTCKMVFTDITETGPVTNITMITIKDKIHLSWSKPANKYDKPHGYIVNITQVNSGCRTYIIEMMKINIITNDFCSIQRTELDHNLKEFYFNNLSTISDFRIEIHPINENKPFRKEVIFLNRNDCFVDCVPLRGIYSGIRSSDKDGRQCTAWENSIYSSEKFSTSNICSSVGDTIPWCPVANSWQYCDIPKCVDIYYGTGCVTMDSIKTFTNSVNIKWYHAPKQRLIGYITLLHNTDHFCQQYHIQLCDQCGSQTNLQISVKNLYLSCTIGRADHSIKYETQFENLHQNKQYFVYIIPIINSSFVGEVKKISVNTQIAKPLIPQNVACQATSVNVIELSWDLQNDTNNNGRPDFYIMSIRQATSLKSKETQVEKSWAKLENLEMCSHYCVSVKGSNSAGFSKFSEERCCSTLAGKPDNTNLDDPISEYSKNRLIKWKPVNEKKNCGKIYRLIYWIKYSKEKLSVLTNETSYRLENLKENSTYLVKVRGENKMETVNNELIGEYSETKEFYTGLQRQAVTNLKVKFSSQRLHIYFNDSEKSNVNIKYKIMITQTKTSFCANINNLVYETYINHANESISTDVLKKCGSHLLEVSPVDSLNNIKGFGKSASTSFIYDIDQRSMISVVASFISSNLLNVWVVRKVTDRRCGVLGFVIEVSNEEYPSNCFVRILSNVDCSELRNKINELSKCPNVELVKWNDESLKINEVFMEIFRYNTKYRIKVWTIRNEVKEIASIFTVNTYSRDCFTDCYSKRRYYSGIRSADQDGNACSSWRDTSYATLKHRRSNICSSIADNKTWCQVSNKWKYCDIPLCSDIRSGTGCVSVDYTRISNHSVKIIWSPTQYSYRIIGFITLLHSTDHFCQQYHIQLCKKCGSQLYLNIRVKNFYLSCTTGRVNQSIKYETRFDNLDPNKQYFVYIIPIVNSSFVGEVKNISIPTILEKLGIKDRSYESSSQENAINCESCFTDCYVNRIYSGIRSAGKYGNKCIQWKHTKEPYLKEVSNLCRFADYSSIPWCYSNKDSWEYCEVPQCSDILSGPGCLSISSVTTSDNSTSISWFPQHDNSIIGYITLLHTVNQFCQQYHLQLCDQCGSQTNLQSSVNSFYLSCATGRIDQFIEYKTHFNNLEPKEQYFVYIIPIVNSSFVGQIKNLTLRKQKCRNCIKQSPMPIQNI